MIGYPLWLIGRATVIAFALVTWTYCVTTYSPFAFDMFVRPRLFTWLETFVNWHHALYFAAYAIAVLTLLPDLVGARARAHPGARLAAAGFAIVFFLIGAWLAGSPYIPLLSTTSRGPATAFVALAPLLWLAVIDLLAGRSALRDSPSGSVPLWSATLASTVIVWVAHFSSALLKEPAMISDGLLLTAAAWSLAFDFAAYAILFLLLFLAGATARLTARSAEWKFALHAALLALGVAEFFRRLVFPSLAFAAGDALPIAMAFGITMSACICSMWLRSPALTSRTAAGVMALATILISFAVVDRIEQADWDFLIQKSVVLVEGLLVFMLIKKVVDRQRPSDFGLGGAIALPSAALLLLLAVVAATPAAHIIRTRYAVLDPAFRLVGDALIAHDGQDGDYAVALRDAAERSLEPLETVPSLGFAAAPLPGDRARPHIFMFVIDGLRRDYLSPYNPAVTFTPAFDEWAREALVFQNAFTKYGGTWLAMPSIWSGMPARRGWSRGGFDRVNSLEKLIVENGYQFIINDFTVEGHLRADTRRTFIDPEIKSIDTDICTNVAAISKLIDAGTPAFTFVAPMNVYTLNASRSPIVDGFSSGYAENVRRVDRCFGEFVANLKSTGIYDNSVIVVTADHGESLGEHGNYGHQFFLFPEDIRIPLMISVPASMRNQWSTDLGRIAFSPDIVPTLYKLLGYEVRDLGPLAGSPLLTTPDVELPSRRRESYLVMSSYGASFGMLRRNGKFLYISDLINYREHAFDLFPQPIGVPVRVTDDLRSVNQALIRANVAAIDAFFAAR